MVHFSSIPDVATVNIHEVHSPSRVWKVTENKEAGRRKQGLTPKCREAREGLILGDAIESGVARLFPLFGSRKPHAILAGQLLDYCRLWSLESTRVSDFSRYKTARNRVSPCIETRRILASSFFCNTVIKKDLRCT